MQPNAFQRTKEDVADKVRKLLTQAEDPAATPEEAQAFTEKAHFLLVKYAIDVAMVTDLNGGDQITARGLRLDPPYANHKVHLVNAVARANDCRGIYTDLPAGVKHVEVVGFATDLEWVETLARSLEVQMASALAHAMRARAEGVNGRTFAVGFVQGFIAEVGRRLQHARREAVAAAESARTTERRAASELALERGVAQPPDEPSVAMVLVAKDARVEEEFTVRHPHVRTVYRHTRLRSWAGFGPGRAAGRSASLARGSVGSRRSLSA